MSKAFYIIHTSFVGISVKLTMVCIPRWLGHLLFTMGTVKLVELPPFSLHSCRITRATRMRICMSMTIILIKRMRKAEKGRHFSGSSSWEFTPCWAAYASTTFGVYTSSYTDSWSLIFLCRSQCEDLNSQYSRCTHKVTGPLLFI